MTPFRDTLKSHFIPFTNLITVTEDLVYDCVRTLSTYIVHTGFISDGASIPRFLWPIIGHPFDYRWRRESVLHDWFYTMTDHAVTRRTADKIFYDGLRANGLRWSKAQVMYLGVRIGGWRGWNSKGNLI